MAAEKAHAGVPRRILNRGGCGLFAFVAPRLRRQSSDETRRCPPIARELLAIGGKIGGLAPFRLQPGLDLTRGGTPPPHAVSPPRLPRGSRRPPRPPPHPPPA